MSGHSKWSTIKHKKAAKDARKGKLFTKFIKEITVAARMGGGDLNSNPRLRTAVLTARAQSMPNDNIERAIKKGTGELEGVNYDEVTYEGYGPGGVALLIQTLTDNKNRTVGEIRHLLAKHAGNLAAENSVAWMFTRKGQIFVEKKKIDEEKLLSVALDAGADDMNDDESGWEIVCAPENFEAVRDAVKALGVEPASAEVAMVPQNYVKLVGKEAQQMLRLMEVIEEHDDVQHVWANFDIEEKEIEASLA